MSAVEWVCRHAGGCLIETPDLAVPQPPPFGRPWRWAATIWPDDLRADGWAALVWEPGERGWYLPATLAIGDVVEFGISWQDDHQAHLATVRWYGWLQRCTTRAVLLVGGYPHPDDAFAAARPVVDELRLDQLTLPVNADLDGIVAQVDE